MGSAFGTVRTVRDIDPDRVCRNIGRRIAELREERSLTQEQLSVLLASSSQWISQIEAGRNMTVHSLVRVAEALRVPVQQLFDAPKAQPRVRRAGRPRRP
ncbi:MAG TPA: helix-turn-helix transcriptional regulator [Polyangiaceae bacterium]